ncbi:MAG: hypothetical protein R2751_13790 [Bacteroidales bacterium]
MARALDKRIRILLCHHCGTSFERDRDYRHCSNCFACTGCEIYLCPSCGGEITVRPKEQPSSHGTASR